MNLKKIKRKNLLLLSKIVSFSVHYDQLCELQKDQKIFLYYYYYCIIQLFVHWHNL